MHVYMCNNILKICYAYMQIYMCICAYVMYKYTLLLWLGGDLYLGSHLKLNIFFQNYLTLHLCKDVSNRLKLSSSVVTDTYWNLIDLKEDNGGPWQIKKKMWHDNNCKLYIKTWFISTSSLLFFSTNICTPFLPESSVLRFCCGTLHLPFCWRKEAVLEFLDCYDDIPHIYASSL